MPGQVKQITGTTQFERRERQGGGLKNHRHAESHSSRMNDKTRAQAQCHQETGDFPSQGRLRQYEDVVRTGRQPQQYGCHEKSCQRFHWDHPRTLFWD